MSQKSQKKPKNGSRSKINPTKLQHKAIGGLALVDLRKRLDARDFKIGEKVEIVGNTAVFARTNMTKPYLGRVTKVDGEYVMVKPRYQRWEGEWYRCELRKISTS